MKLLITGGAGFIGSNFARYWTTQHPEDTVVILDKLTYAGNLQNIADIATRVTFVQGDICDTETVRQAMSGCSTVVHFAAESHVDRSIANPDVFIQTNVLGTHTLLRVARELDIARFHHVSTDEVLGQLPLETNERWDENSPYNPRSPYSASKAASDHLARAYYTTYGLPITISNCANNYGPYLYPEKLLSLAITNLLEGKKVPIYGTGDQVREWLYAEDHCRGIEAILQKGTVGETYFIGPGEQRVTNLELIRKVLGMMGKNENSMEFVADRPGHDQRYALSIAKIERELDWHPTVLLDEGLQKMIDWYTQNESWWKPIKSGDYKKYYAQHYGTRG